MITILQPGDSTKLVWSLYYSPVTVQSWYDHSTTVRWRYEASMIAPLHSGDGKKLEILIKVLHFNPCYYLQM
jgi:hypothetical protein